MVSIQNIVLSIALTLLLTPGWAFAGKALTFATDPFPPYYYEEGGIPKGMQYELAKTIFNKINSEFRIQFVPWKRALLMAEAGKVDGIFGLRKTKRRESWLIYPQEPLMKVTTVVFKRADDPFQFIGVPSLSGKKIGTIKGYTYGSEFDRSTLFAKEEVASLRQNFLKLLAGRVDLVAGYRAVGVHVLQNMDLEDKITLCPGRIHVTPLYIGFTRTPDNARISKNFSRFLADFKESKECEELLKKLGISSTIISPCD